MSGVRPRVLCAYGTWRPESTPGIPDSYDPKSYSGFAGLKSGLTLSMQFFVNPLLETFSKTVRMVCLNRFYPT